MVTTKLDVNAEASTAEILVFDGENQVGKIVCNLSEDTHKIEGNLRELLNYEDTVLGRDEFESSFRLKNGRQNDPL
ncbi:MAG TPA: hypothetical protein GX523_17660 [Desulfitobacterium dehalogenans]|uniref:Uncharacterized protein n=1 Tax=Desulfitobacterium dehalogenans TaxID=36854 RepID=A0A7C6Z6M4_9FIRM|nr:hypothetical protein [Desulfitobacterium dehalogenans]